jgi:hypothetical protein
MKKLPVVAATILLATLPIAAFAQSAAADDYAGRPFPLWVFLVPIAGIIALIAAYGAKAAVEKRR